MMQDIFDYFRRKKLLLLGFLGCCIIFVVVFRLYGIDWQAVFYPALLSGVLVLCLLGVDLTRWLRHRQTLRFILRDPEMLARQYLPADAAPEYRQIVLRLLENQEALRQQQARQNQDMVDYYTTWVHQIKTPLSSMKLTLQGEDSPAARLMSADLLRTEQYVDMVMTFLRLESDSTDYVIRSYDLDSIVRSSLRKFAGEFILRKLRLQYAPLNTQVLTDEKWLSFVIEQVLSNALKYTPAGSVTVTLEPGQVLCIRDTGIGIAPEDLPRIFQRGFTGGNGRLEQHASGIGLYLCKQICTRLGHRIWAQSQPGQGTAVFLDLSRQELEIE